MIAAYDENGTPDIMNAAWGGISSANQISMCISPGHKTVKNILFSEANLFPNAAPVNLFFFCNIFLNDSKLQVSDFPFCNAHRITCQTEKQINDKENRNKNTGINQPDWTNTYPAASPQMARRTKKKKDDKKGASMVYC